MVSYEGRYWRIPAGPTPWDLPGTRLYGKGVEDGVVRSVGVIPKPLQKPHPPLFQPFASSERSIRWCAQEGVTAVLPLMHPKNEVALFRLYREVSGRPLGEGMGVLRDLIIADSDEEAKALWQDSAVFVGNTWFEPFGFFKGMLDPDTGEMVDPFEEDLVLVGTVDTVTRQLERLMKRIPANWIFAWLYNGFIPHAKLMRTIELFYTKVLPRFA
jgi:alkanesulfonate monooxygenase SsuD/methylene tetrahydromethanopterin reductase-like flavin-dependent oxidoreductase (luciferase family)